MLTVALPPAFTILTMAAMPRATTPAAFVHSLFHRAISTNGVLAMEILLIPRRPQSSWMPVKLTPYFLRSMIPRAVLLPIQIYLKQAIPFRPLSERAINQASLVFRLTALLERHLSHTCGS